MRKTGSLLSFLAIVTVCTAAFAAQPPEIPWPKTPFAQGLHLPVFASGPAQRGAVVPAGSCGSSSCTSPVDAVCGQCSIACQLGKASVCYPGSHVEDTKGKESCAQRPACSCN